MAQAGIIKSITGIVTALNPQGESRQLQVGDIVYENEIINADSGASASIELDNGQVLDLAENAQAVLDESVTGPLEPSDAVIGEVEALQAALEEGEDITEDEETAAGEEDAGFDYGLAYTPGDQTGGDVGSYLFGTEYGVAAEVPPDDPGTVEEAVPTSAVEESVPTSAMVTLSAPESAYESDDGFIIYTATVDTVQSVDITVTLDNGLVIIIPAGSISGVGSLPIQSDDVYRDPGTVVAGIIDVSVGGTDNISFDPTPVITEVVDTINDTTVRLTATPDIVEGNNFITYTATVDHPPQSDITVTLSNGEIISILNGKTTGSVTVPVQSDDVYNDPSTESVTIVDADSDNYENLVIDSTPAVTTIKDTINTTTVFLNDVTVDEDGTITYTASVDNAPQGPFSVILDNGVVINFADGALTGSSTPMVAQGDDIYVDADSFTVSIAGTSGGNYENVDTSDKALVTINDTIDDVRVTLNAELTESEGGNAISYTATLNGGTANNDITVTLDNGETITISAGSTTGTTDTPTQTDDVYLDGEIVVNHIVSAVEANAGTPGALENLVVDDTPVSTVVSDTINDVTVTLSAESTEFEGANAITYTATLNGGTANNDITVTLDNGETITISAGSTTGTTDTLTQTDDVYLDGETVVNHIVSAVEANAGTPGALENLVVDDTPVSTVVSDTINDVTVTLSAESTEFEGTNAITYTATLNGGTANNDITVTLDNGETITISAGSTTGITDTPTQTDDVYLDGATVVNHIVSAVEANAGTPGALENLVVDDTPVSTVVSDTIDDVTVSLSAEPTEFEGANAITYTATLNGGTANNDITVTLDNGETITISAGSTTGTTDTPTQADDVYLDGETVVNHIVSAVETNAGMPGALENLVVDDTPVSTVVSDTIDNVTVSLSAETTEFEGANAITYTATLNGGTANNDITVTLDNGETITISAGSITGTTDTPTQTDDIYLDGETVVNHIVSAVETNAGTPGALENLVVDDTSVSTVVSDTINDVTVTLSAEPSEFEGANAITYTATLNGGMANNDITVTLDNGETITISAGSITGTTDTPTQTDDVYLDGETVVNHIVSAVEANAGTPGALENLVVDDTPVSTVVSDTINDVTVTLSAESTAFEGDNAITYTATLNGGTANNDITVTLDNGETITISAGSTTGTTDTPTQADDVYLDGETVVNHIVSAVEANAGTPGALENLVVDDTPVSTVVSDTINDVTVTLSAEPTEFEGGNAITYTATLNGGTANNNITVTLDNGETITISAGSTTGTTDTPTQTDDVYLDGETVVNHIVSVVEDNAGTPGALENLAVDDTPVSTIVSDTINDVTVTLSAEPTEFEGANAITYTATLNGGTANNDITVTLDNGETITISAGSITGTTDIPTQTDDVYLDGETVVNHIVSAVETNAGTPGALENLVVDDTPVSTIVSDTIDNVTVTLSAEPTEFEGANAITYTATLNGGTANNDITVTLDNGETITISAGSITGTTDIPTQTDDVYLDGETVVNHIVSAVEANAVTLENLVVDDTPVSTVVSDTIDTTTVTVTETTNIDGGVPYYTYTATVGNTPDNGTSLVLNLDNGESITINNGNTSASSVSSSTQASSVSVSTTDGEDGNYEHLDVSWAFGDSAQELVMEDSLVDDVPDNSTVTGNLQLDDSGNLTVTNVSLTDSDGNHDGTLDPVTGILTIETAAGTLEIYTQDYAGENAGYYKYTLLNPTTDVIAPDGTPDLNSVENFVYTVEYDAGFSVSATLTVTIIDDVPTIDATNLAIPNIESEFQGSYTFDIGADTQVFADSFNADSLEWTNNPDPTKYSFDYDQVNSTDTAKVYNVTYDNQDGGTLTFFTVTVNADGTYDFDMITPEPVTTTSIDNILQGITGGSNLASYTFASSTFDNYFSLKLTGYSGATGKPDTLTISADDLGVGDNVMHGNKVDMLKFDVLPEAGYEDVRISEMTLQLATTGGVKTSDLVDVNIVYTDGSSSGWQSQTIGSDYDIDILPDAGLTVDYIQIMPENAAVSFKITGVALSYDLTQYPDDYDLHFSLTVTDADGDSATTNFTVAVSAEDADTGTYEITGTTGDDFVYGTDDGDVLDGNDGNDAIFFDADDTSVDGGSGYDTLLVHDTSGTLDFSRISNIEAVDLHEDGTTQDVTLNLDHVLDIVGNGGTLEVSGGDAGDIIRFNDGDTADGETAQWTSSDNGDGSDTFTHVDSSQTVNVVPVDDVDNRIQVDGNIDI